MQLLSALFGLLGIRCRSGFLLFCTLALLLATAAAEIGAAVPCYSLLLDTSPPWLPLGFDSSGDPALANSTGADAEGAANLTGAEGAAGAGGGADGGAVAVAPSDATETLLVGSVALVGVFFTTASFAFGVLLIAQRSLERVAKKIGANGGAAKGRRRVPEYAPRGRAL